MLSLKSLRSMAIGLCTLFSFSAIASDFTCPVPTQFQNIACDGTIEVKNLTELLNYKNNLGIKKNKAKNLVIDFNLNSNALTLSTPCKILFAEKRSVKINGDLCLHGELGINFGEKSTLIADNIELESNQKIVINERSSVEALNLTITAFDRLSLGSQSLYNITEDFRLYTKGDDNAVVNEGVKINAGLFELQTYEKARLAENVKIKADTVIINGKTCAISHQTTSIIASEKLGSCFLQSSGKGLFSVDKHTGFAPLTVNFDASKIESDSFVWSFGNGVTLTSSTPKITYTYPLPGNFTATLKYKEKDHEHHKNKKFKTAGSIQITVKESVNPPPVASLSCTTNNLLVNCNALGSYDPSGSALSFTFDYADGFVESNTSGISSHAYTNAGLYLVKLTVSNLAGVTSEATASVQPVIPPNVLPSLVLNCVTPTNLKPNTLECDSIGSADADGTIVSYQYLFDDGAVVTTSSFNKVTHSFFNGGSHTVKLTAVDNDGGVASVEKSVAVIDNANPVANFNCTSDKPYQIKCQSTSTDPNSPNDEIVQYSWILNNEVFTSLTSNILDYNFQSAGEFPVTLTVKDSYGATNSISKNIVVKDNNPPSVELFASTISGSIPLDVNFEARNAFDIDGSIVKTEWSFPDGTTIIGANTTRQFTEVGETIVTLKVTDDLGAVTTKNIIIEALEPLKTKPIAFFKYSQDGTYLTLSAQLTKTQFDIKKAYYTIDNNPNTTARINLSEFYFNTIKTADLKTLGVHTVTLTVEDIRGQTDSYTHTVDIKEDLTKILPFLDFTLTQSSPLTIFLDLSKSFNSAPGENEDIAFYQIDYGNGTYEEIKNTDLTIRSFSTHTYAAAGTYTVTVSMGTLQGTKAILSKEINITAEDVPVVDPIANFQYQIYNFAQNVNFYNERSGSPNGGIISYFWEFGDGETGTGARVAHFYNPGSYLAKLTVTDFAGLTSTQVQRVAVSGVGDNIASSIACSRDHARANCLMIALDQLSQINYLKLNWGDTNEDFPFLYIPGQGVYLGTHEFTNNGTFNIKFTVGTERGETKVVETSFTTNTLVADIGCTTYNLMVYCSAGGSYDPSGSSLSYKFEYGDDTIDENNSGFSNHAYAQSGLNTVKLTVTNQFGQEATATTQVMPLQGPNIIPLAKFNCGSPTPYTLYCWDDGSGDADGTLVVKKLEFDDDTTDFLMNGAPTRHQFATAGNHTVKLSVVDNEGGTNEMTKSFVIAENNNPVASFECVTYPGLRVGCYTTSTDPDDGDNVVRFEWSFGDGNIQNGLLGSFDHTYSLSATYTIKLTAYDQFGGSSTTTREIATVGFAPPTFEISSDGIVGTPPFEVNFQAINVASQEGMIASYKWTFADGTESDQQNVAHTFLDLGVYNVKLMVTDSHGITSEKGITVRVLPPSNLVIATDVNAGPANLMVHFDASQSSDPDGQIVKFEWFYLGSKIGEGEYLDYEFDSIGTNIIELVATNSEGLKTRTSKEINVTVPAIYIDGNFPESAYVGRVYKAQTDLQLSPSILKENITYQLIDAPAEVSFDENTKYLSWVPSLADKGQVSFILEASDGILTYQKKIKIHVYELQRLATMNSGGETGIYDFNLSEEMGDAHLVYPQNDTPYTLELYRVKDIPEVRLLADTSIPIKNPIQINFDKELEVEESVTSLEGKRGRGFLNPYPRSSRVGKRSGNIKLCAADLSVKNIKLGFSTNNFAEKAITQAVDTSNLIYIEKTINRNDRDFLNVLDVIHKTKIEQSKVKIYFMKNFNFLNIRKGDVIYAFVNPEDENSIYINVSDFISKGAVFAKYVFLHESFHLTQFRITGCLTTNEFSSKPIGLANLLEGSADYYAFRKMNTASEQQEITLKEYSDILYGALGENDLNNYPLNPYGIVSNAISKGLFNVDTDSYKTRLFWEYSPINMYDFFNSYGKNFRTPPYTIKTDDDVIVALKASEIPTQMNGLGATTLGDGILNLTHYLSNFYRADFILPAYSFLELPLTAQLYDTSKFRWNEDLQHSKPGSIFDSQLIGVSRAIPARITIPSIAAMSGVSVNFSSFGGTNALSSQMNTMLKISFNTDNGNISAKVLSVVEQQNGLVNPIKTFTHSNYEPKTGNDEWLIGTPGDAYEGSFDSINLEEWGGLNTVGLNYYTNHNNQAPPQTEIDNYFWFNGPAVKEKIIMTFANTSLHEKTGLEVTIQPLCRKFSLIAPANSHKYRVRFKCDQKCISERTINACWTGRAGYSAGEYCSGGHRMPINGALQGVPAVTALANWTKNNYIPSDVTTDFYICSEAESENIDKSILEMYIDDN